jgi:hypothetical protein
VVHEARHIGVALDQLLQNRAVHRSSARPGDGAFDGEPAEFVAEAERRFVVAQQSTRRRLVGGLADVAE